METFGDKILLNQKLKDFIPISERFGFAKFDMKIGIDTGTNDDPDENSYTSTKFLLCTLKLTGIMNKLRKEQEVIANTIARDLIGHRAYHDLITYYKLNSQFIHPIYVFNCIVNLGPRPQASSIEKWKYTFEGIVRDMKLSKDSELIEFRNLGHSTIKDLQDQMIDQHKTYVMMNETKEIITEALKQIQELLNNFRTLLLEYWFLLMFVLILPYFN